MAQREMVEATNLLDRRTWERLGDEEVDFYRTARGLVDAANTIGKAASASAQVAESASRAWTAEAHRMDLVVRELMHQVDSHTPPSHR